MHGQLSQPTEPGPFLQSGTIDSSAGSKGSMMYGHGHVPTCRNPLPAQVDVWTGDVTGSVPQMMLGGQTFETVPTTAVAWAPDVIWLIPTTLAM